MAKPTTKAELFDWLRRERAGWEALLNKVGSGRIRSPGAIGAWSFADRVAHLTAWQQPQRARLVCAGGGAVYSRSTHALALRSLCAVASTR